MFMTRDYKKRDTAVSMLKERVASGGLVDFEVSSESMKPLLKCGDLVYVRKVDFKDISRGDLILYDRDNVFYVHRNIKEQNMPDGSKSFMTKGDYSFDFDVENIKESQLIGKVMAVKSGGKIIETDSLMWSVLNAIMATLSIMQANTLRFLQNARRVVLKNKVFKPGEYIRDAICSGFYLFQKITVFSLKLFSSASKN